MGRALAYFWLVLVSLGALGATLLEVLGPVPTTVVSPITVESSGLPGTVTGSVPLAEMEQRVVSRHQINETILGPALSEPSAIRIASPAPDLNEPSLAFPNQFLPRIGLNGRMARTVYARPPIPPDPRPRIGLVLSGVGQSEAESLDLINKLPGPVTLAVSPYSRVFATVLDAARAHGHEYLLSVPMEPERPQDDAGPHALLRGVSPDENRLNLEWALSRFDGYVGVTGAGDNGMRGERFSGQTSSFGLALDEFAKRGLLYVDARPNPGRPFPSAVLSVLPSTLPFRAIDLVLDGAPARAEIQAKLLAAERMARQTGSVLVLAGPPRPVTIELLVAWTRGLEDRGFVLTPASALVTTAPTRLSTP